MNNFGKLLVLHCWFYVKTPPAFLLNIRRISGSKHLFLYASSVLGKTKFVEIFDTKFEWNLISVTAPTKANLHSFRMYHQVQTWLERSWILELRINVKNVDLCQPSAELLYVCFMREDEIVDVEYAANVTGEFPMDFLGEDIVTVLYKTFQLRIICKSMTILNRKSRRDNNCGWPTIIKKKMTSIIITDISFKCGFVLKTIHVVQTPKPKFYFSPFTMLKNWAQ